MHQYNNYRKILITIIFLQCALLFAAVPSGFYYFARNKSKAELKTALKQVSSPLRLLDYGSGTGFTWEGFYYTDQKNDGSVYDMYSPMVRMINGFGSVNEMHIEHSFPKSWWGGYPNNAYKDLFHLYPADGVTNMTKSNLPLGEVIGTPTLDNGVTKIGNNGFGNSYTDNCFEPSDEFKGDFARSYLYITTIYEDYASLWKSPMLNNNTYPVWKKWAVDLLLKWHNQDPVSQKELTRIEAVYTLQGNRNPFIDYPDLAEYIWGKDTMKVFPFPEETMPFLVTPRRGSSIDFGVILQNDVRRHDLHLQGVNLNSSVLARIKNNTPSLSLSTSTLAVQSALDGIDFSIVFSPTTSGPVNDTLIIEGGGLIESFQIPIKALASADFITLEATDIKPVGGTLQWISDPNATDYQLSLYQGDQYAGDLILSTYVEGTSWNKAIEIYNGTGKNVDLSKYSLKKQSDGSGNFSSALQLSGTLENNKSYVIVHRKSTNTDLISKAQLLDTIVLNMNGNDAVALLRNEVIIDMVGHANAGASVIWGLDKTLQRKRNVTHPISTFKPEEWTTYPIDTWTMLGNHDINFTTSSNYLLQNVSTGKTTSYTIENLMPESTYTYSVEAIKPNGINVAINTMQLKTKNLDIPILMQATNIKHNHFNANWEETLYASGYLLNVFTFNGAADTTVTEGFDAVGTNGKPLPVGWTGTASGNYETTSSSGSAIPAMGLKNNGEWLQTKNYPSPVSKFSFMYRFPSAATGSSFIVEGLSGNNWVRIDSIAYKGTTSKIYPVYNFTKSHNITAFRFSYKKSSGNLAIDDVQTIYGNQDTTFVVKDFPVINTFAGVDGLNEKTNYFYTVRALLGNSVSLVSDKMGITTPVKTKLTEKTKNNITIEFHNGNLYIEGLQGDETIQIYTITGICTYYSTAVSESQNINFLQKGISIIRISNKHYTFVNKLLY